MLGTVGTDRVLWGEGALGDDGTLCLHLTMIASDSI